MSANISILGNLGRTPETHTKPDGSVVASFSIASNTVRNTPQGAVKKTDWFRVTALGKQAETLARHAKKGSRLFVTGKLTFNPWKDRAGRPQVSADLLLQDFQFVGSGGENDSAANQSASGGEIESGVEATIPGDVQEVGGEAYTH